METRSCFRQEENRSIARLNWRTAGRERYTRNSANYMKIKLNMKFSVSNIILMETTHFVTLMEKIKCINVALHLS